MTPELNAAINKLPDDMREFVRGTLEEGERASFAAKFEDMGYDECETCQQARLRASWRLTGVPIWRQAAQ